jgi:hypothetical protein
MLVSISSTRPSASAVRNWEAYDGPILSIGSSDFHGHWQSHDIGVRIFGFAVPEGRGCDAIFDDIARRSNSFRVHERSPNEMALRRNLGDSAADGFDEYRFVCMPDSNRVYGMFANLDSEMQMHTELVRKLPEIANEKSE